MEESMNYSLEDTSVGNKSNMTVTLVVLVVVALAGLGYWYLRPSALPLPPASPEQEASYGDSMTLEPSPANPSSSADPAALEEEVKVFRLKAADFRFSPSVISVKQGDNVRIILTNNDDSGDKARFKMKHDFALDEFDVLSDEAEEGETVEVEFTADQIGQFEFYCSVSDHREEGQVGTFIVTE